MNSERYTEEWLSAYNAARKGGRKSGPRQPGKASGGPNELRESALQHVDTVRVHPKHDYKADFVHQCWLVGIRLQPEFKIFDDRKFKADWRVTGENTRILVEFEGGLFGFGKRGHNSVSGILRDITKYNLCALAGWLVIRITPKHIESGQALRWVEQAIRLGCTLGDEVKEPFADNPRDARGRVLYLLGDVVTIPFLSYPGPVPAPVEAKVIKVHSPTYYEFEWVDEKGRTKRRSLIRSQLP